MELSYDPQYNIAYIQFKEKKENVNSIKLSEDIVVDIASDGTIYGIELLNAREQIKGERIKTFRLLNNSTGQNVEVELPF